MFEKYRYFIALAKEKNITKAAETLYITHQALSHYLTNLEQECGVMLFYRKPKFQLTEEGELFLENIRQVEALESSLYQHFEEVKEGNSGVIRLGTTEGRFPIFMPHLIGTYSQLFPHVQLEVTSANSPALEEMLLNNQLDLIILGAPKKPSRFIQSRLILEERLYVVISEEMLQQYFPQTYPACIQEFRHGADLRKFTHIPFAFNMPTYNSSQIIARLLQQQQIELHCIHTSSHPDLHHRLTTLNYAASFCLTMYLPNLKLINQHTQNKLYAFPIRFLEETNQLHLAYRKDRVFPSYGQALIKLIREQCKPYTDYDPETI
ncbi:LysR family transcriptional regulator [Megasphaera hominis]|jgi:DNA-binding transcriptional LysR family regulator|uniref:LysR family transcriptional regulator n=1 Tax=Megasphaera hominis TaxID=159836 RepID=A0ABR6VJF1_9FIRM|nr:LysR family transcriptional regulator [Megasphaera hominis]MBC3537408.1 LysR family transcriptional regulator [Megasphaera hominis]